MLAEEQREKMSRELDQWESREKWEKAKRNAIASGRGEEWRMEEEKRKEKEEKRKELAERAYEESKEKAIRLRAETLVRKFKGEAVPPHEDYTIERTKYSVLLQKLGVSFQLISFAFSPLFRSPVVIVAEVERDMILTSNRNQMTEQQKNIRRPFHPIKSNPGLKPE